MFKRSILLVLSIVALVFTSAFASQWMATSSLPSAYDPGVSIETAFKTSKVPVLIEFYSDTCSTCKRVTPVIHHMSQNQLKDKLTLVMMNVEDDDSYQIAQLFGVDELPAVYVFDPKRMKKQTVDSKAFESEEALETAINEALTKKSPAQTAKK
jgi:thioredoxin-like negative regulator of GroEL